MGRKITHFIAIHLEFIYWKIVKIDAVFDEKIKA